MALIQKPAAPPTKKQLKIRLTEEVLNEVEAYCKWQELETEHFIEQAILEIFKMDKDWKDYKKKIA